ncbi:MAG: hypothetical protein WDN47_02415 [Candidatus Doudnabacteria bacterium]
MLKMQRSYIPYAVAFVLIFCICGLVYAEVQQDLRQTANDPQIQMAEDAAIQVQAGSQPHFSIQNIDIAKSLSPYLVIFDKQGNPIMSDALLDGKIPTPPAGVFDTAKQRGEFLVTWQPRPDVRQALVIVPVKNDAGQFVAAGRSLREVEKREDKALQMAIAAWVIMLAVSYAGIFLVMKKS